eukprot:TRINITY_DN12546_c0_g1_i1.p1 TRINITY_DN12546_c0_g1~~TRINITY_DN12546_c0_g1_i1.p1  ORF type:complete len:457 (-),score=107.02 TRINITY_DN12546_c0_g1_i1:1104-2474(-)
MDRNKDTVVHQQVSLASSSEEETEETTTQPDAATADSEPTNSDLTKLKLLYLVTWMAYAAVMPYQPLFFSSIGFSNTYIGALMCVAPFARLVGAPLFTGLGDYLQKRSLVFVLTLIISSVLRFGLIWVNSDRQIAIGCLYISAEFIYACTSSFIEALAYQMLGKHAKKLYGRQRLWGSVGWGAFSVIAGLSIDLAKSVNIVFYIQLGMTFLVVFFVLLSSLSFDREVIEQQNINNDQAIYSHETPSSWFRMIIHVVCNIEVFSFLTMVFVWGVLTGFIFSFLFVYMENYLHSSSLLMGSLLAITCVAELPFFFFSGAWIKLLGHAGVLVVSVGCLSIRLIVYSIVSNGFQIIPVEILHGFSFGAAWGAMTGFANDHSPRGFEATMQGILQATSTGLGVGIGGLASGFLFDLFGPIKMFRFGALFGLIPIVLALLHQVTTTCSRKKYEDYVVIEPEE